MGAIHGISSSNFSPKTCYPQNHKQNYILYVSPYEILMRILHVSRAHIGCVICCFPPLLQSITGSRICLFFLLLTVLATISLSHVILCELYFEPLTTLEFGWAKARRMAWHGTALNCILYLILFVLNRIV